MYTTVWIVTILIQWNILFVQLVSTVNNGCCFYHHGEAYAFPFLDVGARFFLPLDISIKWESLDFKLQNWLNLFSKGVLVFLR